VNKQEIERIEAVASRHTVSGLIWVCGGWADITHEQDAKLAGDTVDIQTGQIQIMKRCLCLLYLQMCQYRSFTQQCFLLYVHIS